MFTIYAAKYYYYFGVLLSSSAVLLLLLLLLLLFLSSRGFSPYMQLQLRLLHLLYYILSHFEGNFVTDILKFCKSVHHHTFKINQPTRCKNISSLLLDVYVQLNMFRASSSPSSGAQQLQWQPLLLPLERGCNIAVVCGRGRLRPTALLPPRSNGKTKGCYCS